MKYSVIHSMQLVAHESVLQFAPPRSWHELEAIREGKLSVEHLDACIHRLCASVPALGLVLQKSLELRQKGNERPYTAAQHILTFVLNHCIVAWEEVARYPAEPPNAAAFQSDDWREVCVLSLLSPLVESCAADRLLLRHAANTSTTQISGAAKGRKS